MNGVPINKGHGLDSKEGCRKCEANRTGNDGII